MFKLQNRFRLYMLIQVCVVLGVILLFRFISDKRLASVFASLLFIGGASAILWLEKKQADFLKSPSFWGALIFLLANALPIFILRLVNWEIPFDEIQWMGITGPMMHKISNYMFGTMMICFFIDAQRERLKALK